MAAFQNFRSAFNGFNREDVVHYIEYVNNKHAAELNQLHTELATLRSLQQAPQISEVETELRALLEQETARCAALEQELEALRAQLNADQQKNDEELEAYRRAERAERLAHERVAQLYHQANGVLADVTTRTDETVRQLNDMTDSVCAQLAQLQATLNTGANAIRDTAAAMYAIRPLSDEE